MSYRPPFRDFTMRRMGNPTGPWDGLRRMFARSFGAKSFADFWRYWNPVYHYFLSYWVYQPLRKVLPRPLAVLLTFAFCGFFFHDLLLLPFTHMPLITVWFLLLGIGVIVGEILHMDLSAQPQSFRIVANVVYIAGLFELARRITLQLLAA
jgi:hypothetical protein